MAKFKVLELNQRYMAYLGIHSHNLNNPINEFARSFAAYYFVFSIVLYGIIGSSVFIWKHWPKMEIVSEPIFITVAGSQLVGMFVCFGLKMKMVKSLHLNLQDLVDKGRLKIEIDFHITLSSYTHVN